MRHRRPRFQKDTVAKIAPPDVMRVEMAAPTVHGRSLERDSFTWTVLTALVDEVVATVSADLTLTITLAVHRSEAVRP